MQKNVCVFIKYMLKYILISGRYINISLKKGENKMFEYKLNDKIFVADVYDRDTNIGYIYFKLITYDNNIYAEEVLSKIIFPISSEIYRASLYELVNGTKYQFYVNTFSELRIGSDGNIYGSNISKWKNNLAAKEIDFKNLSEYFDAYISNLD